MAIIIQEDTKVIVQGITGSFGATHTRLSLAYGTQIVAGVTPSKGGEMFENKVPVFDTVYEAKKETGASASVIFVPPAFASDAILEAVNAELDLVVCITEGIPVLDMARVKSVVKNSSSLLIGPNCPGIVVPGLGENSYGGCRMGISPSYIHRRGKVGVVSRSGTLTYEAVWQLTQLGLGQSTCVGIGGDPIGGLSHLDAIRLFEEDDETEAIVMIGEIGGCAEQEAAYWVKENGSKPVAAFIAGATAPPGRRMGHAGALVGGAEDTAEAKKKVLREAGIAVAQTPAEIGATLLSLL